MNTIFTPLITANLLRHRRVLVNQRRRSILVIKIMMMVISLLSSACQEKVTSSEALVPSLLPFTATLDEDISIGTRIGSIEYLHEGETPISAFTLSETVHFEIDDSGEIKTKLTFDYETQHSYSLSVFATNKFGNSESTDVSISIKKMKETDHTRFEGTPVLDSFETYISEDIAPNVVIGKVPVLRTNMSTSTSPIQFFTLSDNRHFDINQLGEISAKSSFNYQKQSRYTLTVTATNDVGEGMSSEVTIFIMDPSVTIPLCSGAQLSFDSKGEPLPSWLTYQDEHSMATIFQWSPIIEATSYEVTFSLNGGEDFVVDQSAEVEPMIAFEQVLLQAGYEVYTHPTQGYSSLSSPQFGEGVGVELSMIAYQGDEVLNHFDPVHFVLGRETFSKVPQPVTSRSGIDGPILEWCPVEMASSYIIKYGVDEENLDQRIRGVSPGVVSTTIEELAGQQEYFFSIAAASQQGKGQFSEVISTIADEVKTPFDLSIDKVTFNQSVQIDLLDPTIETPVIANKSGVLRVFVNSDSAHKSLKVEVKLGGSHNGTALKPIIKEVALKHSPFEEADSANGVIHFNINDPKWLREDTNFFIELDPHHKLTEIDEDNNRYPSWTDELSFYFEERPPMRIKLFSITTQDGENTGVISSELINEVERHLTSIFPLSEVEISVGESFSSSAVLSDEKRSWEVVLSELASQKNAQVSIDPSEADVFYYGVVNCGGRCRSLQGLAVLSVLPNFDQLVGMGKIDQITSRRFAQVMAHELGHNHGRRHINAADESDVCGQPINIDSDYPYNSEEMIYGRIGKTGYDHIEHRLLHKEEYHDMMTYCDRVWISDYTYTGIHDFKVRLDRHYQDTLRNSDEQKSQEKMLGMMMYGAIASTENGDSEVALHHRQQLTWTPKITINETEPFVHIHFVDGSDMLIPLVLNELDHSEDKLFNFFIPSLQEVDSIIIKDNGSSWSYDM